jgi:hypothetical protein
MKTWVVVAVGVVTGLGCGGQTLPTGSGGDGGSSGSGGSGGGSGGSSGGSDAAAGVDSPVVFADATTGFDAPSGIVCNPGPASGSSGGGSCMISASETCSDGYTYQVTCECPSAQCTCSEMSMNGGGGSGGGGPVYSACPSCGDPSAAFLACGFPQ